MVSKAAQHPKRRIRTIIAIMMLAIPSLAFAAHFLAKDFEEVYLPRARTVAIAPLANLTSEKEAAQADLAIREAIFFELNRQHREGRGLLSSPDALRNSVGGTVAGKFPYRPKD